MALTYKYQLTSLKVKDVVDGDKTLKDAIVQTYWTLTGTDENNNSGIFTGATPFQPKGDDFTTFKKISEEDVLKWISDVVENTPDYKQHIEEKILEQIEKNTEVLKEASLTK